MCAARRRCVVAVAVFFSLYSCLFPSTMKGQQTGVSVRAPLLIPRFSVDNPWIASTVIPAASLQQNNKGIPFSNLRRECGHSVLTNDSAEVLLRYVGLATSIPEYHDCQRMILPDEAHYGQLAAVYATQQSRPTDPSPAYAYLLVQVLNYGAVGYGSQDTYEPLGMRPGASCLYAQLTPFPDNKAWLRPLGEALDCPDSVITVAGLPDAVLEVRKMPPPSTHVCIGTHCTDTPLRPEDFPRVARWDWDSVNHQQYIGVECGFAWCEIGKRGFTPSPLPDPPVRAPNAQSRVYAIKGWFDVQRLAVKDGDHLVPGRAVGYIFPDLSLDARDAAEFARTNPYVPVAILSLSANDTMYFRKYQMSTRAVTLLGVHNPTPGNTAVRQSWRGAVMRAIDQGQRPAKLRRVEFCKIPEVPRLRGIARFHWSEKDETVWTSCINGCCQVESVQ